MNALFDTNLLVDYEAGSEKAGRELEQYDSLFISRIVWIEFLVGAKTAASEAARLKFLERFTLLEIDTAVARKAVALRKNSRLKLPDAIILATARVHGLLLVTCNSKDFSRREPDIRIAY